LDIRDKRQLRDLQQQEDAYGMEDIGGNGVS
jgi:hypothetical protein